MGKEEEAKRTPPVMAPYAVTAKLFAAAKPDALFMHCLPAHPGEEVEQAVLDNPRSHHLRPGRKPPARAEGDPGGARCSRKLRSPS